MRRSAALMLLVIVGLPAAPAPACDLTLCPPVGGKLASILYYVIEGQPAPFAQRYEYMNGIVVFHDMTLNHRVVHEFRSPVVLAVCEQHRVQFEAQHGIALGPKIQGELFEVLSVATGDRTGTVFIDRGNAGVRATGGSLSAELWYQCTSSMAVVQKVSLFDRALDVAAIDGANAHRIESEYISKIRAALLDSARTHMTDEGCTELTADEYDALLLSGLVDCEVHFDSGDPGAPVFSQPPPPH